MIKRVVFLVFCCLAMVRISYAQENSVQSLFAYVEAHSQTPVIIATKSPLDDGNAVILAYLPHKTYKVLVKGKLNAHTIKDFLYWSIDYTDKYNTHIFSYKYAQEYTQGITVAFYGFASNVEKMATLHKAGITSYFINPAGFYDCNDIDSFQFLQLASANIVEYIDFLPQDTTLGFIGNLQAINSSDARWAISPQGWGLDGRGLTIGVGDLGKIYHIDIKNKVTVNGISTTDQHGSHVLGNIVGSGHIDEYNRGYAPKAKVQYYSMSNIINSSINLLNTQGMNLTNNSYGNYSIPTYGVYSLVSLKIDTMIKNHPKLLHIYAAGNFGDSASLYAPAGYGTINSNGQSAKNSLSVGGITPVVPEYFFTSSCGPTRSGAVKPEMLAVLEQVSCSPNDMGYFKLGGTSMAAPNVTGAASLLTQQYKRLHQDSLPDGILLKNLLCNAAIDKGARGLDYKCGFGALDLEGALQILANNRYWYDSVTDGNTKSHHIQLPSGCNNVKIMITWNDPAGVANNGALINNLDLKASASGNIYYPQTLDPANPSALAISTVADTINNIEQIILNKNTSDTLGVDISVTGTEISTLNQPYYVSWTYDDTNKIVITNPVAGEIFARQNPQTSSNQLTSNPLIIRFNTGNKVSQHKVYYSTDGGGSWALMTTLAAGVRYFQSIVPGAVESNRCRVKVVRVGAADSAATSDFYLIQRPEIYLPDSLQCYSQQPAIRITNYMLNDTLCMFKYDNALDSMVAVDTVIATAAPEMIYTFNGLNLSQKNYVAVAKIKYGKLGNRSWAIAIDTSTITLSAKIFLQGAYNTTLNRHKDVTAAWVSVLRNNATHQPYANPAFNYYCDATVDSSIFASTAGDNDIVDWVLVELKDGANNLVARRTALVLENGNVVDTDGVSAVKFEVAKGSYVVNVKHRNHLPVRSAVAIDFTTGNATYDFTTSQSAAYQNLAVNTNAAMAATGSKFAMWGGNGANTTSAAMNSVRVNGSNAVNDYGYLLSTLGSNTSINSTYSNADYNLDGNVRTTGANSVNDYALLLIILGNNTSTSAHQ